MAYFDFEPEERFRSTWSPVIDVYELANEIVIRVELPGVGKDDVRLRWKNSVLSITGMKRRQPSEGDSGRYLCVERQYGRFRRDVAVSTPIDFEKARAEFNNGLLRIRLPKQGEVGDSFIPIE